MDGAGDAAHARMSCAAVRLWPYAARAMPDRMPRTAGRRGRCGGFGMPCRHGRAYVQHKSVRKEAGTRLSLTRTDQIWLSRYTALKPHLRAAARRRGAMPPRLHDRSRAGLHGARPPPMGVGHLFASTGAPRRPARRAPATAGPRRFGDSYGVAWPAAALPAGRRVTACRFPRRQLGSYRDPPNSGKLVT